MHAKTARSLLAVLACPEDKGPLYKPLPSPDPWSTLSAVRQSPYYKPALRRLLDAGVIEGGQPNNTINRLLRGTSLCCDAPLLYWRRPTSRLFVGVEQLFGAGPAAVRHPELLPGLSGLRPLLTVAG